MNRHEELTTEALYRYDSIFVLIIRRLPSSTPFPTRRSSDLRTSSSRTVPSGCCPAASSSSSNRMTDSPADSRRPVPRSEEHTSELQSRFDLVCRLLLEKKNTPAARSSAPAVSESETSTRYRR